MAYVSKTDEVSEINFLASEKFVSFPRQVDDTSYAVKTDSRGHKIIPAGAIYPTNDAKAEGVTIDEVDVTYGAQPVGVIVEGYLHDSKLPAEPEATAVAALTKITFVDTPATAGVEA
ncbi:hypothetical protein C5Z25_01575 [Lactobacillus sp. CBA3605]|uniref:hypothetical protein n=1 Tax=Lactobacillus sp. CBA3605 TaxID=2099788 RepID=UPI000CFBA58D|nr:hypothetical protein [Lactobacillus sp. CBA3605]AVK60537.1 hypothetical protein C5Z25_01575 [Lactobacillus sp. CBA3605]